MLTKLLLMAAELKKDELIYLPADFAYIEGIKVFHAGMREYYTAIALINYSQLQISAKDLKTALSIKTYTCGITERSAHLPAGYIPGWKTRHRLNVKTNGKTLLISTNEDGFVDMAHSCDSLTVYNDDAKYNDYPAHMHHDMDENTVKSLGINFYYWQCPPQDQFT